MNLKDTYDELSRGSHAFPGVPFTLASHSPWLRLLDHPVGFLGWLWEWV